MPHPLYQDAPDCDSFVADVLAIESGRVLTARSPIFPGGGGQLMDRGSLTIDGMAMPVVAVEIHEAGVWHAIDGGVPDAARVELRIDRAFRALQSELHTLAQRSRTWSTRSSSGRSTGRCSPARS